MKGPARISIALLATTTAFLGLASAVYANTGVDAIFGFVDGRGSPPSDWFSTKGAILFLVIILEAVILWRMLKISPVRALIAAIILNFISAMGGLLWERGAMNQPTFSGTIMIPLLPIYIIGAVVLFDYLKSPVWFLVVAIVASAVGLILNQNIASLRPHLTPLEFLYFLEAPLVFCFGFTLFIEGLFVKLFIKDRSPWVALLTVNVASYILIAGLAPFYGANPYWIHDINYQYGELEFSEEMISYIHDRRASNLYLLGLTDNPNRPGVYDGKFENRALYNADPATASTQLMVRIAEETMSLPRLDPQARQMLEMQSAYFQLWDDIRRAIDAGDSESMVNLYAQVEELIGSSMGSRDYSLTSHQPLDTLVQLLNEAESPLTPPVTSFMSQRAVINAYSKPFLMRDPNPALESIDMALEDHSSSQDYLHSLRSIRPYFEYWSSAKNAVAQGDQTLLGQTATEWQAWFSSQGDESTVVRNFATPEKVIEALVDSTSTGLRMPDFPDEPVPP